MGFIFYCEDHSFIFYCSPSYWLASIPDFKWWEMVGRWLPAATSLQLPMFKPVAKAYLQAQQKSQIASLWLWLDDAPSQPLRPGWGSDWPGLNPVNPETRTHYIRMRKDVVLQKKKNKRKLGPHVRRGNKCGLKSKCPQWVSSKWKPRFATSY